MRAFAFTAIAAVIVTIPAFAEEEHRELGAHVHGHGNLNIAVEGARLTMELEVPGMDIVGFEHAAESADQKAAVDKATKQLGEPLALFKLPASAGCKVAEAKVAIETEGEHEDGGAGHDHDAKAKEHGDDHAKGEHDEHEGKEGHNAFHVSYTFECAKPAELTSIAFDYFKSFAGAQDLTVNVVTAKAQNSYQVSRDKPVLDLGGTM